jgi:hypothetical protein
MGADIGTADTELMAHGGLSAPQTGLAIGQTRPPEDISE